jgi:transposase
MRNGSCSLHSSRSQDQSRPESQSRDERLRVRILYVLRTGCSWRQMPHDLPNGKTVYHYFRRWKLDGTWEKAMTHLRRAVRTQMGRDPEPSAAIIDSQSIKTSPVRGIERGYDPGKKNLGTQTPGAG